MTSPDAIVIETPRLLLRRLTDADLALLYDFHLDPEFNRFLGGPPAPREEWIAGQASRWRDHEREHGWTQWAVERKDDGAFLGRCGLIMQRVDGAPEVEVGYALGRPFWGRGYASEAAIASRDHAFRHTDVPHVISLIAPDNAPSLAVARRNGMSFWKPGNHRGYDVHVFRITRDEWQRLTNP
jgi:RimJ/RimL family protein N-acetyltransferase